MTTSRLLDPASDATGTAVTPDDDLLRRVVATLERALPDGWAGEIIPLTRPLVTGEGGDLSEVFAPIFDGEATYAYLVARPDVAGTPPDDRILAVLSLAADLGSAEIAARACNENLDPGGLVTDLELRSALDAGDFHVAYQPIVDLRSGDVVSLEALARWTRADGTTVRPDQFIPVAERSTLIDDLTERMLDLMTVDAPTWRQVQPGVSCSVNLSPVQLQTPARIRTTAGLVENCKLAAEELVIEITESSLTTAPALAGTFLARLREEGVRISIDDFGTAYSSLQRLNELPFDHLKIDRTFVNELASVRGATMVRAIITLAKGVGATVIAEGVERVDQATHLSGWRCQYAQGWYFGRPVPVSELLND